jgi:hypothetical protein
VSHEKHAYFQPFQRLTPSKLASYPTLATGLTPGFNEIAELTKNLGASALDEAKAELYAEAGISEYWFICAESRMVDVYREPGPKGYSSHVRLSESQTPQPLRIANVEFRPADFLPPEAR